MASEYSSGNDNEDWEDEDDEIEVNCIDKDNKCATYATEGACKENPGYMTHYCAVSCDTCDAVVEAAKAAEFIEKGVNSKACMDDDYRCLEWSGMGECDANPG